jgi:hypothetical protein
MSSQLQEKFFEKLKKMLGNDLIYIIDYRPDFLMNKNKTGCYEIDIYVPQLKIGFEVQGTQHFKRLGIYNNDPDYSRYNDELKKELAKKEGVYIIEIFEHEVDIYWDILKGIIIKRAKRCLPKKSYWELMRLMWRYDKIRSNEKMDRIILERLEKVGYL